MPPSDPLPLRLSTPFALPLPFGYNEYGADRGYETNFFGDNLEASNVAYPAIDCADLVAEVTMAEGGGAVSVYF